MRIVTWNCQGAFRRKAHKLLALRPDLAVIQECEPPDRLIFPADTEPPAALLWHGDGKKGLAVLAYGDYQLTLAAAHPAVRHCAAIQVRGAVSLNLLALWAMNHANRAMSYVGQVFVAVLHHRQFLRGEHVAVVGDLNSNAQWDKSRPLGNHSHVVGILEELGIRSAYHEFRGECHGQESQPTFYMYRKTDLTFHLDYCFLSSGLIAKLKHVCVGDFAEWRDTSDHCPLVVDLDV